MVDEFDSRLKAYAHKYMVFRNEDHIWSIKCKYGIIQPYSLKNNLLVFVCTFPTRLRKTRFLSNKPSFLYNIQDSHVECNLTFPQEKLEELEKYLTIKKRNIVPEEERERRSQRMKEFHKNKTTNTG